MHPYDGGYSKFLDEMGDPVNMNYPMYEGYVQNIPRNMGVPYNVVPPQMGVMQNPAMYGQRQRATTKKDILTYLQNMIQPRDVEQVVEFDTVKTRHICEGYKEIVLLDKQIVQVPTTNGIICVEVFFCPRCRKLLINSQSLDVY